MPTTAGPPYGGPGGPPTTYFSESNIATVTTETGEIISLVGELPGSGLTQYLVGNQNGKNSYYGTCAPDTCEGIQATGPVSGPQDIDESVDPMVSLTFLDDTWTYNAMYNTPSSLSTLAGTYTGPLDGRTSNGTLTINEDGSFTESNFGEACVATGQFTIINPTYNAYDLTITFAGTDCYPFMIGSSDIGVAAIDTSVTPATLTMGYSLLGPDGRYVSVVQETRTQ